MGVTRLRDARETGSSWWLGAPFALCAGARASPAPLAVGVRALSAVRPGAGGLHLQPFLSASTATGLPCTCSHGTGWTQRLDPRCPCEEELARPGLPLSNCPPSDWWTALT